MVPTLASGQLDKITLSELLGALSHALDLTEGQPAEGSRLQQQRGAHLRAVSDR